MLRAALALAIRWSGLAWLVRNTYARNKASIILYHDPDPESLDRQLEFLRRRYNLIDLDRLVAAVRSGDWSDMPPRSLVVTIDDGHAGNFELLEVFRRHGVRPTIFLCSQIVATTRHFWFEQVDPATAEALKPLPSDVRLAELEERFDFSPAREYGPESRQALSGDEVTALAADCDLQSHTRFHPVLTRCSEDEARREIEGSRTEVEALAGSACTHFAYPNGAYSDREAAIAHEAGYDSARTVDIGWNDRTTDPYRLRILSVADGFSNAMLAADLSGLKWFSRLLRREGRLNGEFKPRWASQQEDPSYERSAASLR